MSVTFTSDIQVVLGSKWTGVIGLNPNDVIVLKKVPAITVWTENGTNTPNTSTNRLRLALSSSYMTEFMGACGSTGPPSYSMLPSYRVSFSNSVQVATLNFGALFTTIGVRRAKRRECPTTFNPDYDTPGKIWLATYPTWTYTLDSFSRYAFILGTASAYELFSSVSPAASDTVSVQDGMTVISDGATTPINFGSTTVGGGTISKTFTLFNLDEVNSLAITSITVPSGFTLTDNVSSPIPAEGSDTFTVRLDDVHVGTKTGEIVIVSDGTPATFNFAISGTVSEAVSEGSASSDDCECDCAPGNIFGSRVFGE